jgi:hypothetical protein
LEFSSTGETVAKRPIAETRAMKVRRVIFPSVSIFSSSFKFDMFQVLLSKAGILITGIQWEIL